VKHRGDSDPSGEVQGKRKTNPETSQLLRGKKNQPARVVDAEAYGRIEGERLRKLEPTPHCPTPEEERQMRRVFEGIPVLVAEDPDSEEGEEEDPKSTTLAFLHGRATRDIEQLTNQIRRICSDKTWTSYQKRVACEQLVELAFLSTQRIHHLAGEFPEPFREIAEELSHFPCLFPAHAEDLQSLQKIMWDEFNLGKRHMLKLRAAPRRKTFSKKTWVNALLLRLIAGVYERGRRENERDPGEKYGGIFQEVANHVSLTPRNAQDWLDVMWKLLVMITPNPEAEPQLRQLVERKSLREKRMRRDGTVSEKTQVHNIRAAIKSKLGVYLKRMLNDSAVHK
jgi:hypothetical protein